jgi:hypothetical protein
LGCFLACRPSADGAICKCSVTHGGA